MSEYLLKTSKCSLFPLRVILVFFVTLVALYICYLSMNQITVEKQTRDVLITSRIAENDCPMDDIPLEDIQYVHFPQPKTYNRGECSCSPVRYFVIVSMQRSGSGWFETLLNSHPNVSSNGEIFSMPKRRADASSIIKTLDTVYNLDWLSSAAKNECATAFGLKWMLNQGLMDHQKKILSYFKAKGVSVIFLFRRNLLRRLISVLANDYDRQKKQFNGTHKSHVHSREEAEILARFRPTINTATLISDLSNAEKAIADCLQYYSSIRHLILYYEDIVNNQNALSRVQEFLGLPIRKLVSRQVKIHTRPLSEQVINWKDVLKTLNETQYKYFLNHADYYN